LCYGLPRFRENLRIDPAEIHAAKDARFIKAPRIAADKSGEFVEGDIKKLDASAKTAVVKTADATEHTFRFAKSTTIHGADKAGTGAKDAFHGLKEGSHVAVHYTATGTTKTANEVDNIGKDGLKATDGTITRIDRTGKTVGVKTADGAEETYRLSDKAAKDAGKDIAKGTEKGAKVTLYYAQEGGKKVVHFFEK
jgi:hypothetical protein